MKFSKVLVAPLAIGTLAVLVALAGCSKGGESAALKKPTTLRYVLWDANQLPQYQAVADKFHEKYPNITIKIEQTGWSNYWTNLQTEFVSGTAPDVFTDHLFYYPEFEANHQLVNIEPMVKRDNVPTDIYFGGLAQLWMHDGKRYGLPKDWDTEAMFYNKDMTKKAGITDEQMNNLTWNPENGGTFQKVAAMLTLDANGNNGLSPTFDKSKVSQYGFITDYPGGANAQGQTTWACFAVSTGWWYNNAPVWGTKFNFDSPDFANTIQWYANMNLKYGYSPSYADLSNGPDSLFVAGKGAIEEEGDWQLKFIAEHAKFPVGIALLPKGPSGNFRTMFNGLADSIWTGSKNQAAAWEWVKFLASKESETLVGTYGDVYPAVPAGAEKSVAVQKEKLHVNPQAFLTEANTKGATFPFPITLHSSKVNQIMQTALQAVFTGQKTADQVVGPANDQINQLFQ